MEKKRKKIANKYKKIKQHCKIETWQLHRTTPLEDDFIAMFLIFDNIVLQFCKF
jgi:hypothetical protein